jgi:hypothetical protein
LLFLTGAAPGITVDSVEPPRIKAAGREAEAKGLTPLGFEDPQPAWTLLLAEMEALDQDLEALGAELQALKDDLETTEMDPASRELMSRMEAHLEALRTQRARAAERLVQAAGAQMEDIRRVPGEIRESGG